MTRAPLSYPLLRIVVGLALLLAPATAHAQSVNTLCCAVAVATGQTSCTFNGPYDSNGFCLFPDGTNGVQIPSVANMPPNATVALADVVTTPYVGFCPFLLFNTAPDFCLAITPEGGLTESSPGYGFVCANAGSYSQYEVCYGPPPCPAGTGIDSTGTSCCTEVQSMNGDGTPCEHMAQPLELPGIPPCQPPVCSNFNCGVLTNNCTGGVTTCGCPAGESCSNIQGGFCQCNAFPSCAELRATCGTVTDSCTGQFESCGSCPKASGQTCINNTCECAVNACSPECINQGGIGCPAGQACAQSGLGCVACNALSCGPNCPGHVCPKNKICDAVGRCVGPEANIPAAPGHMPIAFAASFLALGLVLLRPKRQRS